MSCIKNIVKISRYLLISRYFLGFQTMQYIAFAIYRDTKRSTLVTMHCRPPDFKCTFNLLEHLLRCKWKIMMPHLAESNQHKKLCTFKCVTITMQHLPPDFKEFMKKLLSHHVLCLLFYICLQIVGNGFMKKW